ncbi:Gfo/Idh/MocA family oxidoreductase [Erysipelothrix sp. HDW6A]|uniref:Gfo/Idh/MocA family protein n=1 Tax=Erysipelothrix sp. HDW6A TaxID=2714928 RepID=UPI00140E4A97|nr:Gfo/Idh/MocA family oxidoreductase [Erysipelothrix sp. HDW6A]QIK56566.1 Gfo/Idh/MocA family oxidoreductase [Erysipelothrix sp. HDW6A]
MRIGTIGSGLIVKNFVTAGRLVDGVTFDAVYSRTKERAEAFANELQIPKAYDSYELMLEDQELDAIYIASPNSLHYSQAIQAMKAGKHVIVEKPFAGNTERVEAMIQIAKENKVFLFEAICNIHMPHYEYIKEQIKEIGNIKVVQCNYSQYSSRYDQLLEGNIANVFNPEYSGGALADINIYNIHFVVGLFGKPSSVKYVANLHENGIDTSGIVTLTYPDFVVECVGAKDSFSQNFVQIQGDKGYIMVPSSANIMRSVSTITKDKDVEHHIQDKPVLYYEIEAFKNIIDSNDFEKCYKLLQHSYDVVEVVEAARRDIGKYFKD